MEGPAASGRLSDRIAGGGSDPEWSSLYGRVSALPAVETGALTRLRQEAGTGQYRHQRRYRLHGSDQRCRREGVECGMGEGEHPPHRSTKFPGKRLLVILG